MFSDSYYSARQLFRSLVAKYGGKIDSLYPVPTAELTIDCAWFGSRRPNNVLLHIAGVHGVEGFVGSAIQCQLLSQDLVIPDDTACIFVHPVNPFGMAFRRRANQNNVDLNRNALEDGEWYSGEPEHFDVVRSICAVEVMTNSRVVFLAKALLAVSRYGFATLRQSLAGGQYNHPQDLYYGGAELQPELRLLFQYLTDSIQNLERFVVVDVHSGLGNYADDLLIGQLHSDSGGYDRFESLFGRPLVSAGSEGEDIYSVRGEIIKKLGHLIEAKEKLLFIQEFGTFSGLLVFEALARENLHWFRGGQREGANSLARGDEAPAVDGGCFKSTKRLQEMFVPNDTKWREAVLDRGVKVFQESMKFLLNPLK